MISTRSAQHSGVQQGHDALRAQCLETETSLEPCPQSAVQSEVHFLGWPRAAAQALLKELSQSSTARHTIDQGH